jgi:hypothetical protein
VPMNDQCLTNELARTVLGWKPSSDRFIKLGRGWMPRWRFRPLEELSDALRLLDAAAQRYTITSDGRTFTADVQIDARRGRASGAGKARTITAAVARALGLEVEQ